MARRDAEEYDPLLQENGHLTRLAVSITSSNLALASNGSAAPNSSLASKNDQAVGQALLAELQDIKSDNILRAQGHEATMRRSFSPLAALALGFRLGQLW